MKQALLFRKEKNNIVQCEACAHFCVIPNGGVGVCQVRKNQDGTLYSLVYGKVVAQHVDPIEKKPLFHFLPGTLTYSIATVGCNFKCKHCQNADIAQIKRFSDSDDWIPGASIEPAEIVLAAQEAGCPGISYTYTEPTVFVEFALDVMKLAGAAGLKNIWVTNGYFSEKTFALIKPYLDAVNIDLKFYTDLSYRKICGARLQPVLDNIRRCYDANLHVEVTTLLIPDLNDSDFELERLADFLNGISSEMVWHLSAFHPAHQLTALSPTPLASLNRAKKIGLAAGLKYVYLGNI